MKACVYERAYIYGACGLPGTGDPPVCGEHAKGKCWCGAQATHECCAASSLVCGARLCRDHECCYTAGGLTGSMGFKHSERGFEQHRAWAAAREPGEGEPRG